MAFAYKCIDKWKIFGIIVAGIFLYTGLSLTRTFDSVDSHESSGIDSSSSGYRMAARSSAARRQKININPKYTGNRLPSMHFPKSEAVTSANDPVNDFTSFPCAYGPTPRRPPEMGLTCVRTVGNNLEETALTDCVQLRYPSLKVESPICIYNSSFDITVSKYLRDSGQWEPALVTAFMKYLLANPQVEFLDMGCNVGVYTVTAAKLARKVVCVDPMVPNVKRIMTSLKLGKIQENVTIIWNAIADTRRLVSLLRMTGNVGGTEIRDNVQQNSELAETVTMDDLIPLYRGKQVAIKMDIQEQELAALQGGQKFFSQVDVKMIQMEYILHRKLPSGLEIIAVLKERGFDVFKDINGEVPLNKNEYHNWPDDVYFIKTHY